MLDVVQVIAAQVGYPPNLEPHPAGFEAGNGAEIAFFFIAGAAVVLAALPWAIRNAFKGKWTPLLVLGAGLVCSLDEPMLDVLGHLHWADDLEDVYSNFGVPIPALIPLCYVAFLGLMSYFCYFVIQNGARPRHFVMLLFMGLILDAIMETIGINLGVYEYYGVQPFEAFGFPYWWGFINGGSFLTVGVILWYAVPRLKGWNQLWLLLASTSGMMIHYFVVGGFHILAHNSGLPEWARWVVAGTMMVEVVLWTQLLAHFAARKDDESYVNWTLPRMFRFILTPTEQRRQRLWAQMVEEGRVRTPASRSEPVREPVALA